jgi:3-dehydroquinate synthase
MGPEKGAGVSEPSVRELPSNGTIQVRWRHRVLSCNNAFTAEGDSLAELFPDEAAPHRVLCVMDEGLAAAQPDLPASINTWIDRHASRLSAAGTVLVLPGGEGAKNDRTVFDQTVRAIHDRRICRQSFVLAVGGGAMLDAVGLAASTAHRGVRLIRLPSTTLGQADAGVGVKNGINAFGAKNLIGTFAPPWAVVNDAELLPTLTDRDWRAGLSESLKVALLKSPDLLDDVEQSVKALMARDLKTMERIVTRTADLHVAHIVQGGDPFEIQRARPLDFGHWSAHRLEQMTGFRLSHGDAVAIGLLIDLQYAALSLGGSSSLVSRVTDCLASLGFPLTSDAMGDEDRLLEGIERFREHLGGILAITMVTEIGTSSEVSSIDLDQMRQAIRMVRGRCEKRQTRAG